MGHRLGVREFKAGILCLVPYFKQHMLDGQFLKRASHQSGASRLATGAATFVAPIQDEFGTPPSGGVVSLQFIGSKLFGGTARAMSPATDGGRLIVINPVTGRFTFVGAVSATGGSSLGGLAH